MIYLNLFLVFLKIGAVAFGGGYAIIAIIRDECLAHGWLTEEELLNFIAVAESTPGPIAVNMATFVGSAQAGFWGSLLATLGIILPAFLTMLLIGSLLTKFLKCRGVKAVLDGILPAIISLIITTALAMFLNIVFSLKNINSSIVFDYKALIIFFIIVTVPFVYLKCMKKKLSPILLITLSGVLGICFFGV